MIRYYNDNNDSFMTNNNNMNLYYTAVGGDNAL